MIEIRDFSKEIDINGKIYKIDLGNIQMITKTLNIAKDLEPMLKDFVSDLDGEKLIAISEKLKSHINAVLGDNAASDILGDKINNINNLLDLSVKLTELVKNFRNEIITKRESEYVPEQTK